ncbi:nucleoporin GLE1-like [Amphibalanus amphitrite]|uniref:nucleoporin GLE1-like n=1 Tax=Amphibalanus amphitrite TaxID=1232801 RepID=UPI001C913120|nr:nucleoporin GLE1-like [Amphibalanus amphitrite]
MYPQQLDGDTNEQYYRKLGYDYVDGVVEKQDKFLKRMSGIARLYVALLIARPPQHTPAPPPGAVPARPLGVKHLWRWLAATVNLEPRADVTASILYDALEVGGSTLSAAYGTQFVKLVKLLRTQYLARVQQVTPSGCGGPVVRLEQQLQRIVSTGRVPPPQGELKLYNW